MDDADESSLCLPTEELFKQYSVSELREIEKNMRSDIEQKREELRLMVGRRYRDIIEASDGIHEIKNLSEKCLLALQKVKSNASNLRQQTLQYPPKIAEVVKPEFLGDISLLLAKLLVDSSNIIYFCLYERKFVDMAWLYSFCKHLKNLLKQQFERESPEIQYAFKIWKDTSANRNIMIEKCTEVFFEKNVTSCELSDNLCSFILMENVSIEDCAKTFLSNCEKMLTLNFKDSSFSSREQICSYIKSWQLAVQLVLEVFFFEKPDKNSLICQKLHSLQQCIPGTFLKYLEMQGDGIVQTVHTSILNEFKPSFSCKIEDISNTELMKIIERFVSSSTEQFAMEMKNLIDLYDNLLSLVHLTESTLAQLKLTNQTPEWKSTADCLFNGNTHIITSVFRDAVETRIKEIRFYTPGIDSYNLKNIWSKKKTDSVESDFLHLKVIGLSKEIYEFCKMFDLQFESILNCLKLFETSVLHFFVENKLNEIRQTLADSTFNGVSRLCDHFKAEIEIWLNLINSSELSKAEKDSIILRAVNCAKVFQAMITCCSNFKSSLLVKGISSLASDDCSSAWQKTLEILIELIIQLLRVWAFSVLNDISIQICNHFDALQDLQHELSEHLVDWEFIEIQTETEIKSKIYIPVSASRWSFGILKKLSSSCCLIAAQSIPRKVIESLTENTLVLLLASYENLINNVNGKKISLLQCQIIQLLFDFEILTAVLFSGKHSLTNRVQFCRENLIAFVDAIDWEIMQSHFKRAINHQLLRVETLFNSIMTKNNTISWRSPNAKSQHSEKTGMLLLNSDVGYFFQLPFSEPSDNVIDCKPYFFAESTEHNFPPDVDKQNLTSNIKKSASVASSLYSNISTGWFSKS
ncbi:Conserved oligomeric Golgi complex subunit 1 [Trichinella pseudospiralis]|uniref:Conserved oligomeric Golgi complex subunit 1 n=1 Tax=Trichinella pseudospiralis TaxID=6337 RepID=A0A0V1E7L1_TRIPS|nr:Conserved oligomeric Golgi complex subunit 1 [Trichinella pseudospiralis]KRZ36219.1 Conserved oligomeric Golgi complex subunit 1 [Trichinella pseudospiralis]